MVKTVKSSRSRRAARRDITAKNEGRFRKFIKDPFYRWIFLVCLFWILLGSTVLDWGKSGHISWQPDTIEGDVTLYHSQFLFDQWKHRYPRGHFLINYGIYKPFIENFKDNPVSMRDRSGRIRHAALTTERRQALAGLTRLINFTMGAFTIAGIGLIARRLFKDNLAGILASVFIAVTWLFMFYGVSGCTDIPAMFWFVLSALLGLKAIESNRWIYFVGFGFCSAWAVGTKEGIGTYVFGLWLGIAVLVVQFQRDKGANYKSAIAHLFNKKLIVAGFTALGILLLLEGFVGGAEEFLTRVENWQSVVKEEFGPYNKGQWKTFLRFCRHTYNGLGWPLIGASLIGVVYLGVRHTSKLIFLLLPTITFYAMTVSRIHFTDLRFMLCSYVAVTIIAGKLCADIFRTQKVPRYISILPILLIGTLSFLVTIGIILEMRNDTRVRAENWIYSNVPKGTWIASAMKRQYAPRTSVNGYPTVFRWHVDGVQTGDGIKKIYPEYLIASTEWPCIKPPFASKEIQKQYFEGKSSYKPVADFRCQYFPAETNIFSLAIHPFDRPGRLSPRMVIFKRE